MAKHTTIFDLDNSLYKKKLKEIEQLNKQYATNAKKLLKSNVQDEKKAFGELFKLGQRRNDGLKTQEKLLKQITAHHKAVAATNKADLKHQQTLSKHQDKEHRKETSRFRQRMQEFRRSPVGKFLTTAGSGGRAAGGAVKGIGRAGMSLMGGAAGMLIGASVTGYQRYMQEGAAKAQLAGMGGGRDINRGMGARMGVSLGFNRVESRQHQAAMLRATGSAGPRELQQSMRATGMQAGEAAGIFGTFAQGGMSFGGASGVKRGQSQGGREMQRMISAGMQSGLKRGRLPEFFQGVTKLMQEQQRVRVGEVGAADYSKTLALWGKTGLAGMQGMRGAGILQQINQGIKKPGGGEGGKALMMQAMGFGKPGGGTSFYGAEKQREKGATGGNIMKVMNEVQKQFGTGQEAALTMREVFGVSLEQAEELLKIYDSSEGAEQKLRAIDEVMEESKTLEEQSLENGKALLGQARRMAGRFDKSIAHGAKAAKYIEKVEDWQYKLVDLMFKAVDYLEKLYGEFVLTSRAWAMGEKKQVQEALNAAQTKFYKAQGATGAERAGLLRGGLESAKRAQALAQQDPGILESLGMFAAGGLALREGAAKKAQIEAGELAVQIRGEQSGFSKKKVGQQRAEYLTTTHRQMDLEKQMKKQLPGGGKFLTSAEREQLAARQVMEEQAERREARRIEGPSFTSAKEPGLYKVRNQDSGHSDQEVQIKPQRTR